MSRRQQAGQASDRPGDAPRLARIDLILAELEVYLDHDKQAGAVGADLQSAELAFDSPAPADHFELVSYFIETRSNRSRYFPSNWFSDPAWDILLFLYRAYICGAELTVGDVSHGIGLRPTTAIRWLDIIETAGFIDRRRCELDGRRVFVILSAKGARTMEMHLDSQRPRQIKLASGNRATRAQAAQTAQNPPL